MASDAPDRVNADLVSHQHGEGSVANLMRMEHGDSRFLLDPFQHHSHACRLKPEQGSVILAANRQPQTKVVGGGGGVEHEPLT
jgi:hypothetical protein